MFEAVPMFWRLLLAALSSQAAVALLGALLVSAVSTHLYDKSMEAAMTPIFVVGPICAVVAGVVAWVSRQRRTHDTIR